MTTGLRAGDWYAEACRRARAHGRQKRGAEASTHWPEFSPPVALSDGPLGAVQAADREIGRQMAIRALAVAEFADTRPATADRGQGEPGAMGAERWSARPEILRPVSEWAGRELVVALSISAEAAEALLNRSLTLVKRLPGTLAALEAGALHSGHLWTMLEKVAPIQDDRIRAEVEAELLRWAAGRVVTPTQLNAKARREVARRDAGAAARRLEKALKERGVHLRAHDVDGMATLTVVATMPEAQALYRALIGCAEALDDEDDPRTRGQKMLDCLLDLVLRPGETDLPPVQVLLTIVASLGTLIGGDTPGEIDGHVVPAEMIRQLLAALTAAHRPAGSHGPREQPPTDSAAWQEAEQEELGRWWAEMERRILTGELVDPDPDPIPDQDGSPFAGATPPPDALLHNGPLQEPSTEQYRVGSPPGWWFDDDSEPPEWLFAEASWPPEWLSGDGSRPSEAALEPAGIHEPLPPGDDVPSGRAPADRPRRPPAGTPASLINPATPAPEPDHVPSAGLPLPGRSSRSESSRPDHPTDDGGWWAAADQAVEDANQALARAGRKLAHAKQAVRAAAAADSADEAAWQAGPGGRITSAEDAITALLAATDAQRSQLSDLLATTAGGGLADRPRIALADALSGTLLALTDLPGLSRAGTCGRAACRRAPQRCTHDLRDRPRLGPPGPTDGYRPSAELDRYMRARDRRCRFPGCRRRVPKGGELDHDRPYPGGSTSAENLVGYCTTDHRGKHQAPGWHQRLDPDGTLTVTTPTGLVAVTSPPPY